MRYFTYSEQDRDTYPVCILVSQIQADEIRRTYLTPFGLDPDDVILVTLDYNPNKKKTPIKEMRQYIDEQLTQVFNNVEVQYVLCTDADYFKALTGLPKAEAYLGYVVDTDYNVKAQYLPSWKTVFYDPVKVRAKIQQTMEALINHALRDDRSGGRRIILVDNPEDIRRIDCPGISGFCTVDAAGQVHYFKKTGGT